VRSGISNIASNKVRFMLNRTEREVKDRHMRRQLARINASLVVRSGLYQIIDENQQRIAADKLSLADVQRWIADAVQAARYTIDAPAFEPQVDIRQGNALTVLRRMESESVQCCVTSPPYFQHRDYQHPRQLGQERTPDRYVDRLVAIMEEARRVLRPDGTAWVILGDSYNSNPSTSSTPRSSQGNGTGKFRIPAEHHHEARRGKPNRATPLMRQGIKKKDAIGIPWRVAFGLRDAGWYLRSPITWEKINPMPENVRDRPMQSTEMVFLLSKSGRYLFNRDAVPRGNVWHITWHDYPDGLLEGISPPCLLNSRGAASSLARTRATRCSIPSQEVARLRSQHGS
jgi:hypothetical protein